jgi:hypothetical protein
MERLLVVIAVVCLSLWATDTTHGQLASVAVAQARAGVRSGATAETVEAPTPPMQFAGTYDPALQQLLRRWLRVSDRIHSLEAPFGRITYDHVFEMVRHEQGTLLWIRGSWRLDVQPIQVLPGAVGHRMSRKGKSYAIQPARVDESWIRAGDEIMLASHADRYFIRGPIGQVRREPVSFWDGFFLRIARVFAWRTPIPFSVGVTVEDLRSRYSFQVVRSSSTHICLEAIPLDPDLLDDHSRVRIILDAATFRTKAIQVLAPGENEETVYVFEDVKINHPAHTSAEMILPDLTGYEQR